MKRKITLLIITTLIATGSMLAQTIPANSIRMGEFDPYVSEYFRPMAQGIAVSMGSGWVHTAKVHSTLGFDVTFGIAVTSVPESEGSFTSKDLGGMSNDGYYFTQGNLDSRNGDVITFPNIRTEGSGNAGLPTIHREFETVSPLPVPTINFDAISGMSAKYAGAASIQAGVGLPKGTEVLIRFFPDVSGIVNNTLPSGIDMEMLKTSYWGLGVKHDIKQWIPAISKVPFLQISALFTYSSFNTGFAGDDLLLDPARFGDNIYSELPAETWDDQKFEMKVSSFTGALLVGANIPVFQPFVGIGFNSGKFDAGLTGTYPIIDVNTDLLTAMDYQFVVDRTEQDPLNVEARTTEFNLQAGARLKLGFFVLHYQYTRQKFNMHSGGIAITFK